MYKAYSKKLTSCIKMYFAVHIEKYSTAFMTDTFEFSSMNSANPKQNIAASGNTIFESD